MSAPHTRLDPHSMPLSPRLGIYRWTNTMLASIAHRASGVILVLSIPVYLWLFAHISGSEAQFSQASIWLHNSMGTWFLWISGSALAYHWFNGLRFLLLDMGKGESRTSMKRSATWVIAASFIISAALGILLWL